MPTGTESMNDDTNKILHEFLGKCWHEIENGGECGWCVKCETDLNITGGDDYETDPPLTPSRNERSRG